MGTTTYPLSAQIADTILVHGRRYALHHYCISRRGPKLAYWEFCVLSGRPQGLTLH